MKFFKQDSNDKFVEIETFENIVNSKFISMFFDSNIWYGDYFKFVDNNDDELLFVNISEVDSASTVLGEFILYYNETESEFRFNKLEIIGILAAFGTDRFEYLLKTLKK